MLWTDSFLYLNSLREKEVQPSASLVINIFILQGGLHRIVLAG